MDIYDAVNAKQILRVTKKVEDFACNILSPGRFEHSLRTAKMCRKLCERFLLDVHLGYLAGVSHDLCKNSSDEVLIALAKKDGIPFSSLESRKPSLLHGRAAAVLLQDRFGLENEAVLDAVRWHTFGRKGLCPLGRALFIADKIEPGRKGISKRVRKEILALDFHDMVIRVIEDNIIYLNETGKIVAPETLEMYDEVKAERKQGNICGNLSCG